MHVTSGIEALYSLHFVDWPKILWKVRSAHGQNPKLVRCQFDKMRGLIRQYNTTVEQQSLHDDHIADKLSGSTAAYV